MVVRSCLQPLFVEMLAPLGNECLGLTVTVHLLTGEPAVTSQQVIVQADASQ